MFHNFWSVPALSSDFKDYDIVSSHLGYQKVRARWVPNMLTEDHKKTACCMCFDISDALSQGRRRHVEPYCDRRRDMGVPYHTWKQQYLHWKHTGSLKREKFKQTFSTRKFMCTVFWDRRCVLLVESLPQGTTINSAVYCETLKKLRRAIQNKRRGMLGATILLLCDNARPHSAAQTQDVIASFKWEQMDESWFGTKWFSPLPTPKEVPGWQAIWWWQWRERCSVEVTNIAGGRILWGWYTETCAPLL